MNITEIQELQDIIQTLSSVEEFRPIAKDLNKLYNIEVNSFIEKVAAGGVSDRLKDTLRRVFPQNAPQEENAPQEDQQPFTDEQPTGEIPVQQAQQNAPQTPGGAYTSPGGVEVPSTPQGYRGLGEQVEHEDLQDKFKELSEPFNKFQKYVFQVNQRANGYPPEFVEGLNNGWRQVKNVINKYINKPRRDLNKYIQGLPEPTRHYPQEQDYVLGRSIRLM